MRIVVKKMHCLVVIIGIFSFGALASGQQVTTTGDSITVDYGQSLLQQAFNSKDPGGFGVSSVSSGGCYWERYVGVDADWTAGNMYRDYAQEVMDKNPDFIIFMLGINDISYIDILSKPVAEAKACFKTAIGGVFDRYETYVGRKGGNAQVLVLSILPVVPEMSMDVSHLTWIKDSGLIEDFNTWFEQEVQSRNRFDYLDVNRLIQTQHGWENLYSDGVHLRANSNQGNKWLADQVSSKIIEMEQVPEPATLGLLCLGGWLWRKRSVYPRRTSPL
jgi:lysophospholipase L1-like esterase